MKKTISLLIILILLGQSLVFVCSIARADSSSLHDDFQSTTISSLWDVAKGPAGSSATSGISDPGATDGKVLKLLFPKNGPARTYAPGIASVQECSYGTFTARMKAASCNQNEGVDSGFFIYWIDNVPGVSTEVSTEIDFEFLGESPSIVYMTVWTCHGIPQDAPGNFIRSARAIDLKTGDYWETGLGSSTWDFQYKGKLSTVISDYDSSLNYYTYGFTWSSSSVRWFIYDSAGNEIELFSVTDSAYIPTNPAQLWFNLWHNDVDFITGAALSPPSTDAVSLVDWVDYEPQSAPSPPSPIEKGLNWLQSTQNPVDGSWSAVGTSVGATSLAIMCFINHGEYYNFPVWNGLNYILSKRNPSDGSFGTYQTYETSLAIMALSAAGTVGYKLLIPSLDQDIADAMNWLLSNQNIEANTAISPSNEYYGGWGYGGASSSWADLSNTQFALIGLSTAESYLKLQPHLSNWQAASIFVTRCNNNPTNNPLYLKDDGGFIYQPLSTIRTSTGDSYGSMTAAGVWALALARMAGVTQINMQTKNVYPSDPIDSGLQWLSDHYSVVENPVDYSWGGNNFTYYYFWSVAKAWEVTGQAKVAGHDWITELTNNLVTIQSSSSDGEHWPGTGDEEPDVLATEWAILTMELPIIPQHTLQNSSLRVTLHSGADLHVYDQQGRHVGYNYTAHQNEIQIPGATYTGQGTEPQVITIPLTQGLKYTIEVVGTTGGSYELVVDATTYDVVVAERSFNGTTSAGATLQYNTEVATIAGLSLLMQPQVHDVAETNVVSDRTWVYQGNSAKINVTVQNVGDFNETVAITLYYNVTANEIVGTKNITLLVGESETLSFVWNTLGVGYCHNYTLTAVATIPADITPADNTLSDGHIKVRILGDINGDGKVDMKDIGILAAAFGSYGPNHLYPGSQPSPRWNPDADINGDGRVDMLDVAFTARNFGKRS